jgi:hypothetical protein
VQPSGLSQHPVDQLIRELIVTNRAVTSIEIDAIIARMATAPFDARVLPLPRRYHGMSYLERIIDPREPALFGHLVQRVIGDGQWPRGTSEAAYLADLRAAVRHASARLTVYRRRGGAVAAVVIPTTDVLSADRQGPRALPMLFVAYSADRGTIISGYQASDLRTLTIPEHALWLK